MNVVALLTEGVDRNPCPVTVSRNKRVALLTEGVDRNIMGLKDGNSVTRRPPRGGRG